MHFYNEKSRMYLRKKERKKEGGWRENDKKKLNENVDNLLSKPWMAHRIFALILQRHAQKEKHKIKIYFTVICSWEWDQIIC